MRDQFNLSGDFSGAFVQIGGADRRSRMTSEDAWVHFGKMGLKAEAPGPTALPPGSVMPWSLNPLFVARRDTLTAIAERLSGDRAAAAVVQSAAASGPGGIGKTQVAVEFAHRYGQYFVGGVFWINCSDRDTIAAQVAECGGPGRLDLHPQFDQLLLPDRVALVRQAWAEAYPRLIILDNCESEETFAAWRPTTGGARVLLTSRRSRWSAGLGVAVQTLEVLDRADSRKLLLAFAPGPGLGDDPVVDEIAAELGDLPLALHLAGSFMSQYRYAGLGQPARYLETLRDQVLDHASLIEGDWSPTGHDQHVARTFGVSYLDLDASSEADAGALQILGILSCYAPGEHIPRGYIHARGDEGESQEALERGKEDALRRLSDLGLIDDRGASLVVHRLIAAFVLERIDPKLRLAVEEEILGAAENSNHRRDSRYIAEWEVHLNHIASAAERRNSPFAEAMSRELAMHYYHSGDYAMSRAVNEARLARAEARLPGSEAQVAHALNDMAVSIRPFDPDAAATFLRRSIDLQLQAPEENETSLLMTFVNLGEALYGEAEAHAAFQEARQRFVQIWHRPAGKPDADASDRSEEEMAFAAQVDPDGLWIRIICGLAKVSGDATAEADLLADLLPESPDDVGFRHWEVLQRLGDFRMAAGDLETAQGYLERARAIIEESFGEASPLLGDLFGALGSVTAARLDWRESRRFYSLAMDRAVAALGWNHPASSACSNGLLNAQTNLGEFGEIRTHLTDRLSHLQTGKARSAELLHLLFALGFAHFQLKDAGAAEAHWRRGLKIANRDPLKHRGSIRTFKEFLRRLHQDSGGRSRA